MPIASRILGSGISPQATTNIVGDINSTGLVAAGSSQATALQLTNAINYVATTASSTGVNLPTMNPGDSVYVYNAGANTLSVYGSATINIQNGGAGSAFSVASNKGAWFTLLTSVIMGATLTA